MSLIYVGVDLLMGITRLCLILSCLVASMSPHGAQVCFSPCVVWWSKRPWVIRNWWHLAHRKCVKTGWSLLLLGCMDIS